MQALVPVFEHSVLPHLDAAYNLARWLTRDERDAEDVVQESFLRALRHFHSFKGGDARPWLLAIVRNTFYTWLKHNRSPEEEATLDEEKHPLADDSSDPEMLLLRETDRQLVRDALQQLSREYLEVIVLREFEELSYKEIAEVIQVPCGTVMSRLSRARKRLVQVLVGATNECAPSSRAVPDSKAKCA